MSLGYDTISTHDWNRYFAGCWAFHANAEGEITVYRIQSIDASGDPNELAQHAHCTLTKLPTRANERESRVVLIAELLKSRAWLVHRFPVRYLAHNGNTLYSVSLEPEGVRMVKGTNCESLRLVPPISGSLLMASSHAAYPETSDVATALCQVLSYGLHPYFRGVYRKPLLNCGDEVRAMLLAGKESKTTVIVPDAHTAVILRPDGQSAFMLRNAAYVGRLEMRTPEQLALCIETSSGEYESAEELEYMRLGSTSMAKRLFGNVEVTFS